ncbi:DegT/DnrJ/EryC1/StrS family aminotransferase [Nitrosopumilus sp.]|uniref:DegT/DnrJ/EryC1/StrS family aminotransferase n=1 Tax=Nitrosopumilus sp. TaxID=2024843 RepID=UPI003D123324
MTEKIKLFDPVTNSKEKQAVNDVLQSHFWASGAGTGYVKKFETSFRKYVGAKDCLAVNSGTAALNLALSLIDIKDKEVILPSLSFVSTANAILLNGGKPVFVDIDPKTLCIDSDKIQSSISSKTKIILPVHFGGLPSNIDSIEKICKKNNLSLIEDAAHASGSIFKKKKIGSHGFAVCFSFHPVKNLAMPTGGIIAINSKNHKQISKKIIARRWCGITNRKNFHYDVKEIGWNYYMNEFSAAIGLVQLKKLNMLNKKRQKIAKQYEKELKIPQKMPFSKDCSYHLYWILTKKRKSFMKKMKNMGIETGIHYNPIHKMTLYKSTKELPITEKVGNEVVTIPIHPNLTTENVEKIIKYTNEFS